MGSISGIQTRGETECLYIPMQNGHDLQITSKNLALSHRWKTVKVSYMRKQKLCCENRDTEGGSSFCKCDTEQGLENKIEYSSQSGDLSPRLGEKLTSCWEDFH